VDTNKVWEEMKFYVALAGKALFFLCFYSGESLLRVEGKYGPTAAQTLFAFVA